MKLIVCVPCGLLVLMICSFLLSGCATAEAETESVSESVMITTTTTTATATVATTTAMVETTTTTERECSIQRRNLNLGNVSRFGLSEAKCSTTQRVTNCDLGALRSPFKVAYDPSAHAFFVAFRSRGETGYAICDEGESKLACGIWNFVPIFEGPDANFPLVSNSYQKKDQGLCEVDASSDAGMFVVCNADSPLDKQRFDVADPEDAQSVAVYGDRAFLVTLSGAELRLIIFDLAPLDSNCAPVRVESRSLDNKGTGLSVSIAASADRVVIVTDLGSHTVRYWS